MQLKIKRKSRYILLFIISILGWSMFGVVQSKFIPAGICKEDEYDTVTLDKTNFPKYEGKYTLCVKELQYWNPFIGHTIIKQNINGSFAGYIVDGSWFWQNHPLWQYRDADNAPNQKVPIFVKSQKDYWYDKTPPYCATAKMEMKDKDGNITPYYGGWTKNSVHASFQCKDALSGCKIGDDKYTSPVSVPHNTTYSRTTLQDNVGNGADIVQECQFKVNTPIVHPEVRYCSLYKKSGNDRICVSKSRWGWCKQYQAIPYQDTRVTTTNTSEYDNIAVDNWTITSKECLDYTTIPSRTDPNVTELRVITPLIDTTAPEFSLTDDAGTVISSDISNSELTYTASGRIYEIKMKDPKGADGISGIQMYNFSILRTYDQKGNPVTGTPMVCTLSKTFPAPDANAPSRQETYVMPSISLNCPDDSGIQEAGKYILKAEVRDFAQNTTKIEIPITVYPSNSARTLNVNPPTNITTLSRYANNKDFYQFNVSFTDKYGNPFDRREVKITNTSNTGIFVDQVGRQDENSLRITYGKINPDGSFSEISQPITNEDGKISFQIRSYAPGKIDNQFSASLARWDEKYNQNVTQGAINLPFGDTNSLIFRKPFVSFLDFYGGDDTFVFGQLQAVQFGKFVKNSDILSSITPNPPQYFFVNTIKANQDSVIINKQADSGSTASSGIISFIPEQVSKITPPFGIEARPYVSYNLGGKSVSYFLSVNDDDFSNDPLTLGGGETNSIYIAGNKSSIGKDDLVSNVVSIGKMSFADMQMEIQKQASLLTRNRTPNDGKVINGVKYVSGDFNLSGENPDWNTLIVQGGNLTFTDTFNTSKKNVGIIVLSNGIAGKGNIYIKPNVQFIGATIFSENSLESVDTQGSIFNQSNRSRSVSLSNQIVFFGGLYTRNTVGGAILGKTTRSDSKKYFLPGGAGTDDIHLAVRYDLSFLRMKNFGWNQPPLKPSVGAALNQGRKESVVVLQSDAALSNPPPGFSIMKQ